MTRPPPARSLGISRHVERRHRRHGSRRGREVSDTTGGTRHPHSPIPSVTKVGAALIVVGLVFDLVEHTLVPHLHDAVVAGFPVGEHAAHFVVLIGMVTVLAGIVADGIRATSRIDRQERSPHDALR